MCGNREAWPPEELKTERGYKRLPDYGMLVGAFAIVLVQALRRMADSDLWGHLKCGEYLFKTGSILKTYYFNCSWPDFPYVNHEWLFQAVIYKIHVLFGEAGLIALQAGFMMLSFFILFRTMRLYSRNLALIAFVLALGALASAHRNALRPQHFSYLFLLYFLFSLHRYQRGDLRFAYAMPFLMVLWVNIHAESLWGLVIPGVFVAGEYLKQRLGKGMSKGDFRRLLLISAAVAAASLINPFTYKAALWPLFVMKEQFAGVEELLPSVAPRFFFFWIYFGVFAVSVLLRPGRTDPTWLILSLVFSGIAWTANRGIPHFVFVSAPLVVLQLEALTAGAPDWLRKPAFALKGAIVGGMLFLVFASISSPRFMAEFDGFKYPDGALGFMKEHGIQGNVFNRHMWGCYIIWDSYPSLRPYIDGRFFHKRFYDENNHILSVGAGWQDILDRYGITIALLPYSEAEKGSLNDRLFAVPGWRLVYWDDVSLLYLRDVERNRKVIEEFGNNIINPDRQLYEYRETDAGLLEKAETAAERNLSSAPGSYKARVMMANILFLRGDYGSAARRYEEALPGLAGDRAWVLFRLARSYRNLGDLKRSADYAERCLAAAPDFEDARQLLKEVRWLLRSG